MNDYRYDHRTVEGFILSAIFWGVVGIVIGLLGFTAVLLNLRERRPTLFTAHVITAVLSATLGFVLYNSVFAQALVTAAFALMLLAGVDAVRLPGERALANQRPSSSPPTNRWPRQLRRRVFECGTSSPLLRPRRPEA